MSSLPHSTGKLETQFYIQDTITVARGLLGKKLVRVHKGRRLAGYIVETEAYLGLEDPACHSFNSRRTPRTEVMFGPGGYAYIYFIYGMYNCFNVVTRASGHPEAVLIRALWPAEGIEQMQRHRQKKRLIDLASGPGKLCQALKIDKSLNGKSLTGKEIFIEETGLKIDSRQIIENPRIGIEYAQDAIHWPLRFSIEESLLSF